MAKPKNHSIYLIFNENTGEVAKSFLEKVNAFIWWEKQAWSKNLSKPTKWTRDY